MEEHNEQSEKDNKDLSDFVLVATEENKLKKSRQRNQTTGSSYQIVSGFLTDAANTFGKRTGIGLIFKKGEQNTDQSLSLASLPEEVMRIIFSYLTPEDLANVTLVSKLWNFLGNDENLWESLAKKHEY